MIMGMTWLNLPALNLHFPDEEGELSPFRAAGLATLAIGVVTLGLFVGRELRFRYQFRRRTPSDFFSNAGDALSGADYGMGV